MIRLHRIARHAPLRWATATFALFLLGAGTLAGWPQRPADHSLPVGRWPDAVLLDGGRVFVANDGDGTLSVLDLADDRLLRTVAIGRGVTFAPLSLALATHTHRIFVADRADDGTLSLVHVLDSRSGAQLRIVRVGHTASAVAVDERAGHVFVTNEGDGTVSMLDARSGALLRTSAVGLYPAALTVDARTAHAFVIGPGTFPDYMGSQGEVSLIDTRSGTFLKAVAVGHAPTAIAADVMAGRAFVVNRDDGTVSVLDPRTGRVLRTVRVGAVPRALAVDERRGRVFVLNAGDGTLSVLDAHTGLLRQTLTVDRHPRTDLAAVQPCALAIDEARDRVYVSTPGPLDPDRVPHGQGVLQVFDARSGARLQAIAIGVNPQAIAVDEGSGRVVVTNGGGMLRPDATWLEQGLHWTRGWFPWLGGVTPRSPTTNNIPGSVSLIGPGA